MPENCTMEHYLVTVQRSTFPGNCAFSVATYCKDLSQRDIPRFPSDLLLFTYFVLQHFQKRNRVIRLCPCFRQKFRVKRINCGAFFPRSFYLFPRSYPKRNDSERRKIALVFVSLEFLHRQQY
jgi:hypothetical protein